MKESFGDLESLKKLGEVKKHTFTVEQLLDDQLKNIGGENRKEVSRRMDQALNRVIIENKGKDIAIVSHGASIKFLLMKWCCLNANNQLEFKGKIVNVNSPGVIKLVMDSNNLIELEEIL